MAKQSGIHQIKGKIGEHSYYRQTGVSGGLIRSINQGLSARVKSDEAYANTRLNNQEFGAAANVSALLGKCVTPKFRPMILPFSQSKMAKEILKVAREHEADWGQRVVTAADTVRLCEILSAMSKRDASEFFSASVERDDATNATAKLNVSASQATMLASLGVTSIDVVATQYDVATGQWIPLAQMMSTGYVNTKDSASVAQEEGVTAGTAITLSESFVVENFVPAANHVGHQIVVFVFMPLREINSTPYVLQEYCSFIAMPLPANA